MYALAGHAHVGTCSAIDLVHGFAAQPSVWHFSALVVSIIKCEHHDYLLPPNLSQVTGETPLKPKSTTQR